MRVVAGALIENARLLVACRGPGRAHAGLWELPGGKVEPGESDPSALQREWLEELSLKIEPGRHLITITLDEVPSPLTFAVYLCSRLEGEPVAHEHSEIRWLEHHELGALDWAPADRPVVSCLVDAIRETCTPPHPTHKDSP